MTKLSIDLAQELRLAIAKKGGQKFVALKLGISEPELSRKLSGERGWKISELEVLFSMTNLSISSGSKDIGDSLLIRELSRKLSETLHELEEMQGQRKDGGE